MWKRFKNKQVDGNWLNTNFPCMMACPAHTNAGRYVELIAEGRFEEAYRFAELVFPLLALEGRTNTTALRVNTGPFGETIGDARPTMVRAS